MKSLPQFLKEFWPKLSSRLTSLVRWLFVSLIRFYQIYLRAWLPGRCRFVPTCSEFAHDAFLEKPLFKAFLLVGHRLLRCRPFGPSGWDPVPQNSTKGIHNGKW